MAKTFLNRSAPMRALYIGEGEIEERFIKFLNQNDFIQTGIFRKFNLIQDKFSSISILYKNAKKVFCILDTDQIAASSFSVLAHNIKMLKSICGGRVFLLIQNKNFEDELLYVLDCKNLCTKFDLPHKTHKDLKKYLAQSVRYDQFITKENLARYCQRPDTFKAELKNQNVKIDEKSIILFESCITR